jgi:phosphatidylglycerophosphate synthase
MLSEKLGHVFDKPLESAARFIPFSPNVITIAGFIVTLFASYVLMTNLLLGGILVLVGGVFDILDGVVARTNRKSSKFGAFLDSVLDRYSDAFILLALAWNFMDHNNNIMLLVCLGTLVGSFLISYARARAEGLGENCKYGLMERPERIILLAFGTITGMIIPVLWMLLVLTHFTVLQRIYFVRKTATGL